MSRLAPPGFEPLEWSEGLPIAAPAQSFEQACIAWRAIWSEARPREIASNLRDATIEGVDAVLGPMTSTRTSFSKQAWVASPWSAFCPYAISEAAKLPTLAQRAAARLGALAAGALLIPAAPDRCIQARSFLLSTPIHPMDDDKTRLLSAMAREARDAGLPVLSRGHAGHWCPGLAELARSRGAIALPTRSVWLYDGTKRQIFERHNARVDLKLARKLSPLSLSRPELAKEETWERFATLYAQLYLEKHNRLNPAYTAEFMKRAALTGFVDFVAFPDGHGGFEAVVGLFRADGQATCPVVGLDLSRQKQAGLYRACCAIAYGLSASRGERLNFSSGAGAFKRMRGAEQSLEYALLALPPKDWGKTLFWRSLAFAAEKWAAPAILRGDL